MQSTSHPRLFCQKENHLLMPLTHIVKGICCYAYFCIITYATMFSKSLPLEVYWFRWSLKVGLYQFHNSSKKSLTSDTYTAIIMMSRWNCLANMTKINKNWNGVCSMRIFADGSTNPSNTHNMLEREACYEIDRKVYL